MANVEYKEWYGKNKSRISEKRKARYENDPVYRKAVIERAKKHRQENPRPSTSGTPKFMDVNGVSVRVYRVGEVAVLIGRTEQVLRIWERKQLIPPPTVKGYQRRYTAYQVELLRGLSEVIDQVRYDHASRSFVIEEKSKEVWANWGEKES